DAELPFDCRLVPNLVLASIDLHYAIVDDALREIFVGRPDANLLDLLVFRCEISGGRQRIVRLELNHRPNNDAHSIERFFQWMKLCEQGALDSRSGFVTVPQFIAK